jgi:IS4 transposase
VITAIVGILVLVLMFSVVVAIAKDPGPGPEDVAVAYEVAWDRLDFESLFTLAGRELRDGLDRRQFIEAKRAAYANQTAMTGLEARVGVDDSAESGDAAIVATRVDLHDGGVVHNRVDLARRNGRWEVVGYRLAPVPSADEPPAPLA